MKEIEEKQEELASVEKSKEAADEVLKEKKKEAGKRSRELAELEQNIRVVVSKLCGVKLILIFFSFNLFFNKKIIIF